MELINTQTENWKIFATFCVFSLQKIAYYMDENKEGYRKEEIELAKIPFNNFILL